MNIRAVASNLAWVLAGLAAACTPEARDDGDEQPVAEEPTVVVSGLNGPMGVLVEPDGTVWVVDSGLGGDQTVNAPDPVSLQMAQATFGPTSRIIRVDPSGDEFTFANLPSLKVGGIAFGGARLAMLDGVLYATSGGWIEGTEEYGPTHAGVVRVEPERVTEIANMREIEVAQNPDPAGLETNPYGLTVGPDRLLWITDAAGNALYRVDPEARSIQLVTVFATLPGPVPNPTRGGALEVEPVPTAIAFLNGEAYVAFLPGTPMAAGAAKVVRVSENGEVTDYATGLTRLTDLQAGPDGNLYAVSMSVPDEAGPTGSVLRIGPGTTSETVLSGLAVPTAIAFDGDGAAYVTTNGVGAPGSGQVLRYPGIARVRR